MPLRRENMELRNVIIKKIKYYREQKKISPEDLSYRLGKNRNFINQIEQNKFKKIPSILMLEKIANELDISLEKLMIDD